VPDTSQLISKQQTFRTALLKWYRKNARSLPWRDQPSLYKTVVSEFMLQQTQVKTVLPYFARWMDTLPDFATLAAAPESQVLKIWEGLGYYSRARRLHALAHAIVAFPQPPQTVDDWLALPGIGPYTAAAITSISFRVPAAVVDGNVVRILARLTADETEYRDGSTAAKAYTGLADALINRKKPGDHNQAMMELGATVCARRNPLCSACPVQKLCVADQQETPEVYPRLVTKKIEKVTVDRAWCEQRGRVLLHRTSGDAKRLAHLHELPTFEQIGLAPADAKTLTLIAKKRRSITRYRITEMIYQVASSRIPKSDELIWVPRDEIESLTLSGPHRRWVRELLVKQLKT
jgi:A/G-specific adenine glycosylase